MILRPRETTDGATPSSNSVAAMNLLRLAALTGEDAYQRRTDAIFEAHSDLLRRAPAALPRLLSALDFATAAPREIVLSGEPGRPDFEAMRAAVFASPSPNRILVHADSAESLADVTPLVSGRGAGDGRAVGYVCSDFACRRPTSDPRELAVALDA